MRISQLVMIIVTISSTTIMAISQSTANPISSPSQGSPAITSAQRFSALNDANHALISVLPSFTCDEAITASERENGSTKKRTYITAQFREVKSATTADFVIRDDRTLLTIEGKSARRNNFSSPIKVSGLFGLVLTYFNSEAMSCYDATLRSESDDLVEYELRKKEDVSGSRCSFVTPESTVLVSFNPKTFALRHFDLTQPHAQNTTHSTMVLSLDLRPTTLGGETYMLPKTATATLTDRTAPRSAQWQSQYTGCVLFKATATILPDFTEAPQ